MTNIPFSSGRDDRAQSSTPNWRAPNPDDLILKGGRQMTHAAYQELSELERIELAAIDRRAKHAADLKRYAQERPSIVAHYGTEQADDDVQVVNRLLAEMEVELTRDDPTRSPMLRGLIGLMPLPDDEA